MNRSEWVERCTRWKSIWPIMQEEYYANPNDTSLNIYAVIDAINTHSKSTDILMGDGGSVGYTGPVALKSKENQRMIFSLSQGDMGWVVPASVGAAKVNNDRVIALVGDGSFMTNIQELSVIRYHNLNVKFVLLNNNGYLSIKNTQTKYFDGRVYGTGLDNGIWFPDFKSIANCFEFNYYKAQNSKDLDMFGSWFDEPGPAIIECKCLEYQEILPAQSIKNGKQAPLHDLIPFLSEEELQREMIVDML